MPPLRCASATTCMASVDLPGRLRAEDLDDPAPRQPADAEGEVEGEGARRDGLDADVAPLAEPHDRALAELLLDLAEGHVERLVTIHRGSSWDGRRCCVRVGGSCRCDDPTARVGHDHMAEVPRVSCTLERTPVRRKDLGRKGHEVRTTPGRARTRRGPDSGQGEVGAFKTLTPCPCLAGRGGRAQSDTRARKPSNPDAPICLASARLAAPCAPSGRSCSILLTVLPRRLHRRRRPGRARRRRAPTSTTTTAPPTTTTTDRARGRRPGLHRSPGRGRDSPTATSSSGASRRPTSRPTSTSWPRTGAQWLRVGISWGHVEPSPGVYDWAGIDRVVLGARRRGLSVVAVVSSAPALGLGARMPHERVRAGDPEPYAELRARRGAAVRTARRARTGRSGTSRTTSRSGDRVRTRSRTPSCCDARRSRSTRSTRRPPS